MFRENRTVRYVAATLVLLAVVWAVPVLGDNVTLEVMHRWSGDRHPILREVLDRFEAAHPGVTVVDYQVGSTLNEKLLTAWLAGTGPDIAMTNLSSSPTHGTAGFLMPLTSYVEKEGPAFADKMYPSLWEAVLWENETYYLPMTMNVGRHLLYYNKDMFNEAGLDADNPPKTHSAWLESARRLTRPDGQGDVIHRGIDMVTTTNSRNYRLAETLIEQWGPSLFDSSGTTFLTDVERPIAVMEWMLDFAQRQGGSLASGGSDGRPRFQTEAAAMYMGIDGDWFIFDEANPDFEMAMATVPAPDGEPLRTVVVSGWGWSMSRQTKHPDLAWELVKWLSVEPEGGGYFIQQQGRMSSNPAMNMDPLYLEIHPYWHVLSEVANASVPGPQPCLDITTGEMNTHIGGTLTAAAKGEASIRPGILEAQRILQPKCPMP